MARAAKKKAEMTLEEKLAQALVPDADQPYSVPDNWRWVKLGTLSKVKGGKRVPKGMHLTDEKTDHPYLRVTDFDSFGVDVSAIKYIEDSVYEVIKNYTISVKDIYISIAGSIGKVGIIPEGIEGANLTENAAKITNINGVKQKYLLWYLISEVAQSQMKESTLSTTQPKLALFRIENILIPLPPLSEQQRIVNRIESLFAKLDEAKEKAQAVLDGFEDRKVAILHKAFTGELTAEWRKEKGYENSLYRDTLNQLCIKITDGTHHSPPNEATGDYMYITAKNIKETGVELSNISYVSEDIHNEIYSRCDVRCGDVLYIKDGATTGIATVNTITVPFSLLSSVAVLRVNEDKLYSSYLSYVLNSRDIKSKMLGKMAGVAITRLTLKKIKESIIPVFSLEEQSRIIDTLDCLIQKEQQAKEAAEQVIDQIDTMKKSILARAFRGELGTNDPSDESAVELLKRVLSEK